MTSYSEHDDDGLIPSNAAAIILAVNFLRKHGAELLAKVAPHCGEAWWEEGEG